MNKDLFKKYLIDNVTDDEISAPIESFKFEECEYTYEGRYSDIKQTYAYNSNTEEMDVTVTEIDTQIYTAFSSKDYDNTDMRVIHFRHHYINSEDKYLFKDFADNIMYYPDLMKLLNQYSSCTALVEMQDITGKVIKLILIPNVEIIDSVTMNCFVKRHTYFNMPNYVIYNSKNNKLEPLKEE